MGGGIANGHASSALQLYLVPGSALNYGDYANDDVTAKYTAGTSTSNTSESDALLTDALRLALDDFGVIPIFNPAAIWAVGPGYAYTPRADDLTLVYDVRRTAR